MTTRCFKRLQANLAYLAAMADRPNKPASQVPTHPVWMSAPYLLPRTPLTPQKSPHSVKTDGSGLAEEGYDQRIMAVTEMYQKLQSLFPDFDPTKEPQPPSQAPRPPYPGQPNKPVGNLPQQSRV